METPLKLEPGLVAWYKREDGPIWPVLVLSRRGSYWRCRYLGDHRAKSESLLAQPELLVDFADNIKYAASPNSGLRARLAGACVAALAVVDERGSEAQKKVMNTPTFKTLIEVLSADAVKFEKSTAGSQAEPKSLNSEPRDMETTTPKVNGAADDGEGAAAIKSHLAKCESAVYEQRDLVSRRRAEYDAANRHAETFRKAIREGEKAVRDAEKQLATAKRRAKSAETRLQGCADDLESAQAELQTRQIAQRAARALLRETGSDGSVPSGIKEDVVIENLEAKPLQRTPVTTGKRPRRATKSPMRKALRMENDIPHIDEVVLDGGSMNDVGNATSINNDRRDGMDVNAGSSSAQFRKSAMGSPPPPPLPPPIAPKTTPIKARTTMTSTGRRLTKPKSPMTTRNSNAYWVTPGTTPQRKVTASGTTRPQQQRVRASSSGATPNQAQKLVPKRRKTPLEASVVSPLRREGKKLIIYGTLPANNPHLKAFHALGKTMLVRRPVSETETITPRMAFFEDLQLFQCQKGNTRIPEPIMNGLRIDLYRLMGQTLRVGGYDAVIKMRAYTFVCKEAGALFSNAFFTHKLKNYYSDFVLAYERELVRVVSEKQPEPPKLIAPVAPVQSNGNVPPPPTANGTTTPPPANGSVGNGVVAKPSVPAPADKVIVNTPVAMDTTPVTEKDLSGTTIEKDVVGSVDTTVPAASTVVPASETPAVSTEVTNDATDETSAVVPAVAEQVVTVDPAAATEKTVPEVPAEVPGDKVVHVEAVQAGNGVVGASEVETTPMVVAEPSATASATAIGVAEELVKKIVADSGCT